MLRWAQAEREEELSGKVTMGGESRRGGRMWEGMRWAYMVHELDAIKGTLGGRRSQAASRDVGRLERVGRERQTGAARMKGQK